MLFLLLLNVCAAAQSQTSRYVYDDDGRLRAVIAPSGEAAVYEYDSAGNFTAIRRLGADELELFTFAPRSGLAGTQVVFYGVGFGAGVSGVTFGGGVAGTLVGFTNSTVTAIVPEGAVTGPVTINTARGSVTTATPFVLQGVSISPKEVSVLDGESVQFTATVIIPGDDQEVVWSVDGVVGGSDTLGRINEAGLYTAPPDPPSTFEVTIQATSLALPTLADTANVHVRSLSDFRFTLSRGISIGKGEGFTNASVFSNGVSVGKGEGFANAAAFSRGVSVGKGERFAFGAVFSRGISVGKGEGIANAAAYSRGVTLTKGPVISSVSPDSVARGSSVNVTLGGANFAGASSVRLFNLDGRPASDIDVSIVNVGGSSLTVTINVAAGATTGRRIIVVTTPHGHSVLADVVVNAVEITAP